MILKEIRKPFDSCLANGLRGKSRNFFARKLPLILKKYFRSFFRVKAFDWKNSYWTFWCAISVSILSCYFDYGRRRDKISPFSIFSNTSLLDMSWFIYSNHHFFERPNKSEKLFPRSILFQTWIISEVFLSTSLFSSKSVRNWDDLYLTLV